MDAREKVEVAKELAAKERVGARLKEARTIARLTGAKVGELLGVGKAAVGHWETGRNEVTASILGALADLYGQGCDWLIFGRRRSGLGPQEERLLELFARLDDEDKDELLEFIELRLRRRRAGTPGKSRRTKAA